MNRTVHARYTDMEIVRYDRSGKWYLEPTLTDLPRQHVSVMKAAQAAVWGVRNARGLLSLGLPGGSHFDALVHAADCQETDTEPSV